MRAWRGLGVAFHGGVRLVSFPDNLYAKTVRVSMFVRVPYAGKPDPSIEWRPAKRTKGKTR